MIALDFAEPGIAELSVMAAQAGVEGSVRPIGRHPTPRQVWRAMRGMSRLTDEPGSTP